jgi:hypothetical protein
MTACAVQRVGDNRKMSERPALTLRDGFESYLRAFKWVNQDLALKKWYRRTIFKTGLLSLVFFVLILGGGIWYLNSHVIEFYARLFAVGLLAFAGLYFSATIAGLLMNSLILMVGGEKTIVQFFFPQSHPAAGWQLKDRGNELISALKSLGFGIAAIPFFMLVYTIPIGVFIIAIGIGGEALATAQRISHQFGAKTQEDQKLLRWSTRVGLGLIPAIMGMIPLLGFFFLPVGILGAMDLQNRDRKLNEPN